nr:hypothetical protein [Sicyoidochytrium minutum DNA virus]
MLSLVEGLLLNMFRELA